jgi:hypothetical protein
MPADQPISLDSLLKEEYFFLQKTIEDFDSKSITIKAWSVSGSLVLIGAGLSDKGGKELFLVGAFASLLFWFIEANWKGFQLSFYHRIRNIEAYFLDPQNSQIKPLQMSTAWSHSWKNYYKKKIGKIFWWPAVMLPHLILFLGGIALYFLVLFHVITLSSIVRN